MHSVKLKPEDQQLMVEALVGSQEIKLKKLVKPDSIKIMRKQYYDAASKMLEPITIVKRDNNLMTWFIDQMKHSGRFWGTELCERAVRVAQAVIDDEYDHYKSVAVFEDLFDQK